VTFPDQKRADEKPGFCNTSPIPDRSFGFDRRLQTAGLAAPLAPFLFPGLCGRHSKPQTAPAVWLNIAGFDKAEIVSSVHHS
jgi:hypothetical protein